MASTNPTPATSPAAAALASANAAAAPMATATRSVVRDAEGGVYVGALLNGVKHGHGTSQWLRKNLWANQTELACLFVCCLRPIHTCGPKWLCVQRRVGEWADARSR